VSGLVSLPQVVKSDTDGEVSSEPEHQQQQQQQRAKSPQKKKRPTAPPPGADVVVEDEYSDGDDLPAKVEALSLGAAGGVGGWWVVVGGA